VLTKKAVALTENVLCESEVTNPLIFAVYVDRKSSLPDSLKKFRTAKDHLIIDDIIMAADSSFLQALRQLMMHAQLSA
jgi:hypothetical protein